MKNTNYAIDYARKVIIITKKFGKLAQDFNTPEAREMEKLFEKYPTFAMEYKKVERSKKTETYKGLTIDRMDKFFNSRVHMAAAGEKETVEADLAQFKKVLEHFGREQYVKVKKWFVDNYAKDYEEWSETKEFDTNREA